MKILMRKTFASPSHIINSYDEVHQLDNSLVIPPTMPNLLKDHLQKSEDDLIEYEVLPTSCENLEPSSNIAAPQESNGNAILIEGESSLDVLNFSTTHAMIEQIYVEPLLHFPLSQNNLFDIFCDKNDWNYDIPMPPMMNDHAICLSESNTCAENRHFLHIAGDVDELKLLSSLSTLGYIELDVLCNLSYLEEKLFGYADFPWFSRHTYHAIGKYNNNGQYIIQRV